MSNNADQFVADPFPRYCLRAVFIFIKNALEGLSVARPVGAVGRSYESGAAFQVRGISGKVGMNAFGGLTVDTLQLGRRGEIVSLRCLAVGVFVGLARPVRGPPLPGPSRWPKD